MQNLDLLDIANQKFAHLGKAIREVIKEFPDQPEFQIILVDIKNVQSDFLKHYSRIVRETSVKDMFDKEVDTSDV